METMIVVPFAYLANSGNCIYHNKLFNFITAVLSPYVYVHKLINSILNIHNYIVIIHINMSTKDDYEKPSKHRQWQERSERPIASRPMTPDEIEEHRLNLVNSYKCDDSDITFDFQKILDENDEDRDDCLWLIYKMKCIVAGKPTVRNVFCIKLPIPDELKKMAEHIRRQRGAGTARRKPVKALPAPEPLIEEIPATPQNQPPPTSVSSMTSLATAQEPPVARPKLRKPIRSTRK